MRIQFKEQEFKKHNLSAEKIIEEVETIGFGAELLETIIDNQNYLNSHGSDSDDENRNDDFDARRCLNEVPDVIKVVELVIEGMTCASC